MGCVMFDGFGLGVAKFSDKFTVEPFISRLAPVAAVLNEFKDVVLELTVKLLCCVIA